MDHENWTWKVKQEFFNTHPEAGPLLVSTHPKASSQAKIMI
jgi:hypothetical protein